MTENAPQGLSRLGAIGVTRGYLAVWIIALVVAVLVPVSAAWLLLTDDPEPGWTAYGVTADFHGTKIWEVFGSEARAAGIATFDEVIRVDGVPVAGVGLRRVREVLDREPGQSVLLTIRHPDGSVSKERVHWRADNVASGEATKGRLWEKGSGPIIALGLVAAYSWVIAAILLFGRRREPMAALFSIAFLLLAPFGLGERLLYEFGFYKTQLILAFTGFSLVGLGLLTFPSGRFEPRWTAAVAMLFPVWAILGFIFNEWNLSILSVFLLFMVLEVTAIGIRYRASANDIEKQQIRWFLFGLAVAAFFVLCQLAVRYLLRIGVLTAPWTPGLGSVFASLGSAAVVGGLVISLLRFRLYDANAVIERSVTYGVLTLSLLAIFAGSEKIIEVLGEEYFGDSLGALAGGLGAGVAAVMIGPLHHRITRWAERRFQKNLRRLRLELPLIVSDLRETASTDRLARVVLDEIAAGIRARCSALVLADGTLELRGVTGAEVEEWRRGWSAKPQSGLDCDRSDTLFPLRLPLDASGHERAGWLLIGPRPDGSFYGKDEREALAEIADPIARALTVTRQRAREQAITESVLKEIKRRLSELEQRFEAQPRSPARRRKVP